jgi:LDH2 family malate/lactate/ureidoglycolate dehydrogenase
MGYYPTIAIDAGMIGLAITNSDPYQAPWGGHDEGPRQSGVRSRCARVAPSPAALRWRGHAALDGADPFAGPRGLPLPEGGAVDAEGRPTLDPIAALTGALLPSGGYKGYALSVFWEILTGALADDQPVAGPDGFDRTSLFLLAIDPRATVGSERFLRSVDELIDRIHASPPAAGVARVWAPGERGYVTAEERRTKGVPFNAARIAELRDLGKSLGVAW